MRRYRFHILDVFTDTRFGGNPLAVVLETDVAGGKVAAIGVGGNSVLVSEGWLNAG